MQQPEMNAFKAMEAEQRQLKQKIEEEIGFLQNIYRNHVLDPPDIHKYFTIK